MNNYTNKTKKINDNKTRKINNWTRKIQKETENGIKQEEITNE